MSLATENQAAKSLDQEGSAGSIRLRLETILDEIGAHRLSHTGKTLKDHLIGTFNLLQSWGCNLHVCAAGMFHSIYGTNAFGASCLDKEHRNRLCGLIGERAERLVYLFSVSHRPQAFWECIEDKRIVNRFNGEISMVSEEELRDLLAIECANLIEQGADNGFVDALIGLQEDKRASLICKGTLEGIGDFKNLKEELSKMQTSMAIENKSAEAIQFEEKGYVFMGNLFSKELLEIAWRYYLSYVPVPNYYHVSEEVNAMDRYADALGEVLLLKLQPQLEKRLSMSLLPTCSYVRIYTTDSLLTKHVDRGSCEISATMTVGFKNADGLWPVFVESNGVDIPVELDIGDAMIYRGMDLPHWREPLPKGIWCQIFFHFVDAKGELAAHQYDDRERLGPLCTAWHNA